MTARQAQACACCSEEGEYVIHTGTPGEFELSQMQAMQFGTTAQFFLGPADETSVKGVADDFAGHDIVTLFKAPRADVLHLFADQPATP